MPTLESLRFIKITLCIAGLSYCVKFASSVSDGAQTCGYVIDGHPVNCPPLIAPRNVTVTNKTSTALLINWTHVNHSELLGYRVRFHRNITCDSAGNYTNCSFSIFLCKNYTTIWLEDLEIYTDYWIEVVAFKNGTFSENDTTLVARTDEGVPSQPPEIEATANHSSTSISVTWKSIPEEHRRGVIEKYTVTIREADTGNVTTKEANGTINSIKIHGLKKFTLYYVTVSASTSKGKSIESEEYEIRTDEDAPDGAPILDTDATEVTQHSFVVSWGPGRQRINGILRKYKIRWRKVDSANYHNETLIIESYHSRRRRDIIIPSNRTSFQLKNLSLYTNYSVEIAAVTIKEGNYSSPKYFMTGEGAPTSPPLNVTAHNTSSTSIFVTWSPPPSDNIPGILLGYEVSYTPSEPEISHNSSTIRRVMLCSCNTSIELTNLTVYEPYNITVAAFTSAGIGNESEIRQIWTDEEAPKEAPQNVSAVSETFDSINVTWREVPEEKRDGIIILYQVMVFSDSSYKFHNTTESNRAIKIHGLEMFKMYEVEVRAFTRIGPGRFSDSRELKTKEEAPWFAPNVTGHAINRTAINVTWDIALPKGFKLRGFNVTYGWQNVTYRWQNETYRWQNETYRWQNETVRVNEPERTVVLTGLEVFTKYEIKVAAATNYQGPYSQEILVKTSDGAPSGSPTNVDAVAKSISSINVTWGPVPEFERKGNVTMYEIHVMNSSHYGVANISVCANNFSVVVDELEMFVTYYVRVRALTAVGFGPWSRNVTVATNQKAPDVVLNATASVKNKTSILVSWQIERIHARLQKPDTYQVSYCPHCRRKTCLETNISTSASGLTTLVSSLLVGVTYNVTVRAINITASDGTPVETPYGNYSEPVYNTTHEGAPEVPPNVTAGPLTTTSINVNWSEIPCNKRGGKIINYFIEIHNSSGMILEKQVSGNDSSYEVTGLEVHSNYSARVLAATGAGNSSFSDFYNTTTHQPAPENVPTDVKVKATGKTNITVTWREISDKFLQGYTVKYKKKGAASSNVIEVNRVNEKVLKDLNKFTEYTIQVAARSTQPGNYSEAISAKTLEDVPSAAPPGVYVDVLDSTSARINWGEVPEEKRHGDIIGYRVLYERKQNGKRRRRSVDNFQTVTTVDGAYSILLKSLDKAAEYEVEVRAFTSVGDGPSLPNISFTTSEDIPSKPPVNITTVDRLSPYTIRVSWEPVPKGYRHGTLQNYEVTYQKVEVGNVGIEEEPVKVKIVNASETDVELGGLEPYVRYKITVAASTSKGYGPPSASVSGETCQCKQTFSTSWRRYEPYANVTEDSEPGPIIPVVLQSMVDECCGNCSAYERVRLDFKKNGKNRPALRNSSRELLESLDQETDFTFPVYGFNGQDRYKGGYGYIPVIESAGVAFIVYPQKSSNQNTMYDLMISCLPVLVLPIITACVSGMIIWALAMTIFPVAVSTDGKDGDGLKLEKERVNNSKDFPAPFLQGTWEGIWWAFVSMTTLGYGDRAPLSGKGRLFAIVWILFGLVIIALTMAMLTTALTADAVKEEYKLYGTKIAAEYNSPEYNLGTRRNAKFDKDKHYNNIDEVAQALINKEVDGILVDTYSAGLRGDLFNRPELLVSKIIDYKSAYGVVFSSSTNRLRKCFQRYMVSHKAEIFEMVKKKVKPIETSNSTKSSEEQAGGILDSNSPQFRKGLYYAIVCFGIALLLSLTYEVIRRVRKRHKVHQQVQFKTKLQAEMSHLVEEFMQRTKKIKQRLGEKHRQQILKFWKLQRKGSTTNNWLRISQVSPHPSEVIITDYNC